MASESVARLQERVPFELLPGAFAENILTDGIKLNEMPIGTKLKIGTALCEVTQIGKECHTKAWEIKGTEDLKPYIPIKTVLAKWVGTLVMYPLYALLMAWIMTMIV